MIVFNLTCAREHAFEGWFASGEEFERQSVEGLVSCPICGDHDVSRMPAVPHLRRALAARSEALTDSSLEHLLAEMRDLLEASDDVGEQFANEARRIHYEEAPLRSIRGVTSLEEAGELLEEGIPVLPLMIRPKKGMH